MLDLFFETSWEVCNKVGGIYAVLSTKAKTLQKEYKDKVVFIGPDLGGDNPFFESTKSVLDQWRLQANFPTGMTVKTGRWKVPGNPLAVLVDYNSLYVYKLLEYFSQLNINFKIMEDNEFSKLLIKALYHAESSDSVSVLLNDLNQNDELVYKNKMIVKDNLSQRLFNKIGISFPILDKEYIEKMLNNL